MTNPFEPKPVDILMDAFPQFETDIIEQVLRSVDDKVQDAYEILLSMSDPTCTSPPPPLPKRVDNTVAHPQRPARSAEPSRPTLTFREEMTMWRRQLANESRCRSSRPTWHTTCSDPCMSTTTRHLSDLTKPTPPLPTMGTSARPAVRSRYPTAAPPVPRRPSSQFSSVSDPALPTQHIPSRRNPFEPVHAPLPLSPPPPPLFPSAHSLPPPAYDAREQDVLIETAHIR